MTPASWQLRRAGRTLKNGGVIVYPTEAVQGLGCLPWDAAAVCRILHLKRRAPGKGLIVVASAVEQLRELADFSRVVRLQEVLATWPGHVTWLLPAQAQTPSWLTGQHASLAVRVSAHPVVRQLCVANGPLVSTSANPSGCRPTASRRRARAYFGNKVDCYVPGNTGRARAPSQIRDSGTGRLLRP